MRVMQYVPFLVSAHTVEPKTRKDMSSYHKKERIYQSMVVRESSMEIGHESRRVRRRLGQR